MYPQAAILDSNVSQYHKKRGSKKVKTTNILCDQLDLFTDFSAFTLSPVLLSTFATLFDDISLTTPEKKFAGNINALQLLKALEGSNRKLTREEQKCLLSYSGWGGLSQVFEHYTKDTIWTKRQGILKNTVTEEQFLLLRKSVTTAYYTPVWLIKQLWKAAKHLGFAGGKVLEPSAGIGHFFGLMPEVMQKNSQLTGVEINPISANIAKQLYPNSKITTAGFETVSFPQNYFDLAIGNVPFGEFSVYDSTYNKYNLLIHNYFLVRSLDLVRPGGLGIFVTSTGTMQSEREGGIARKLLSERADLLAAVRLPKGAFSESGTDVSVDILFFKKESH